jgi:hypothetical protein
MGLSYVFSGAGHGADEDFELGHGRGLSKKIKKMQYTTWHL